MNRGQMAFALLIIWGCVLPFATTTPISTFNAAASSVRCAATSVVAGYPVTCIAKLRTAAGTAWGTQHDVCQLFFSFCAVKDSSSRGPLRNATSLGNGYYRLVFYPTVSGWTTLSASVATQSITVTPSSILVNPATIDGYQSTSVCRQTLGITKCNIKHRDAFGNVVSSCAEYSSTTTFKTASKCSTMSLMNP